MKIAIYSRKSKFTGKGESINNQIELCKEYASKHFDNVDEFIIYEDEGFSGGNVDRPQFQKMLADAKLKKFSVLICYRLDRISRNVSDFSGTIEKLSKNNISFISIKEQFDTSTPMGRAMMYITSVFAQLERETIAERIKDNMYQLARSGRWLGGITPTGYKAKAITYIDKNKKEKRKYILTPVSKELEIVKLIYIKYIEFQSLSRLETYFLKNNIKTVNNKNFTKYTLRTILTNPVYAIADKDIYNYFYSRKAQICNSKNEFNGKYGIMAYNKNSVKKGQSVKTKNIDEWIIAIGQHEGIIRGDDWVTVQNILNKNKNLAPRQSISYAAMLSGLLYCKKCGSFMKIKYGQKKKGSNERHFYYVCSLKENSQSSRCDIKNLKGDVADQYVIDELKNIIDSGLLKNIDKTNKNSENKKIIVKNIHRKISSNKKAIDNLLKQLSRYESDTLSKYIFTEIEKLDKENYELKTELEKYNSKTKIANLKLFKEVLIKFYDTIEQISYIQKRNLIQSIIKRIEWDGENLYIDILDT